MFWYSGLITEEFVQYFKNEDAIYFTVNSKGRLYNDIYLKFNSTVQHFIAFINSDKFEENLYYGIKDEYPDLHKLAESFYNDKNRPDFNEVYHSIKGNVFDCDLDSLSADQLAVGLIFPFASRMGGSFEDEFAESGRLRQFVLALYDKSHNQ